MKNKVTLDEMVALSRAGRMSPEEYYQLAEWRDEYRAEQEAETAYERYYDYRAWLRDGWQPAHAF